MISEMAIDFLVAAVKAEKEAAIDVRGLFHSDHEAWAVLKEEVEELCECLDEQEAMHHRLDLLWDMIRINNEIDEGDLNLLYNFAKSCAEEAVQVMAMCLKWGESNEQCEQEEGRSGGDEKMGSPEQD